MSECCSIGIKHKDGIVKAIYCHNDGYIRNGAGKILVKHYTDENTINQLLELGDISSLGTEPIENPDAWKDVPLSCADWFGEWNRLHPTNKCDIYRTRGEDCPAKIFQTVEEYLDYYPNAAYFENGDSFTLI